MGDYLRRYWLPFALAKELEADGASRRAKVTGEASVAFRVFAKLRRRVNKVYCL
jgi:hypothetical protein